MIPVEWCPFRKSSGMFFRILIYTRVEVGEKEQMGICSFKDMRECNGHSEAAPGSECFLRGLPETEGNNDFLSSLSTSHTSQGPEPASSHVLIWMWALKILVQTQTRDLGLLVPFEKKGTVSPNPKRVCPHTHSGMAYLLSTLWAWGSRALRVSGRHLPSNVSHAGSNVPRHMQKPTRRRKTHQEINSYFFNVFLQEPSGTMYRICLFFCFVSWNIKIALHVNYGIITCLYENSE